MVSFASVFKSLKMLNKIICLLILFQSCFGFSQTNIDSISKKNLKVKHFIVPVVLISGGLLMRDPELKQEVYDYHNNILKNNYKFKGDDFLQCVPTILAATGNFIGFKSEHSFLQMATNHGLSVSISGVIARILKVSINDKRPEMFEVRSFPSGHTTTVFNAATLLFLEFKDSNFWYASSGYAFAVATGFFRVANNKHWVADVLAGAGLGMTTAYIVHYWNPNIIKYVDKVIKIPEKLKTALITYPIINESHYGFGFRMNID